MAGDPNSRNIGPIQDVQHRGPRALVEQAGTQPVHFRADLAHAQAPNALAPSGQPDVSHLSEEALQAMGRRPGSDDVHDIEPLRQMLYGLMQEDPRGRENAAPVSRDSEGDMAWTRIGTGRAATVQPSLSDRDAFQEVDAPDGEAAGKNTASNRTSDRLAGLLALNRAEVSPEPAHRTPALRQLDDLLAG